MDPAIARDFGRHRHARGLNRFGEPMVDHLERVAGAVPSEVRALAYLHDVLERSETTADDLRAIGLTRAERAVLQLLTHRPDETYETYVSRIARARGSRGRLARLIKLADLDDHLRHSHIPAGAPDYAWARRQIILADEREAGRLPKATAGIKMNSKMGRTNTRATETMAQLVPSPD